MALSKKDRKFIQDGLPHGAQTEIASDLGISRSSVNQYLTGLRNSTRIEKAVIDKYEKFKTEREEIRKKIYG